MRILLCASNAFCCGYTLQTTWLLCVTLCARNDKVLVMLIKLSYWAFARKRSIHFVILPCFADLFSLCHTERSEVSINLKCEFALLKRILNSLDFSLAKLTQNDKCLRVLPFTKTQNDNAEFLFVLTLCVQNDKGAPSLCYKNAFCSSLWAVFAKNGVVIYQFKRKFNSMDCHEFARLRSANSRNDKFLVILSLWRSICEFKAF